MSADLYTDKYILYGSFRIAKLSYVGYSHLFLDKFLL